MSPYRVLIERLAPKKQGGSTLVELTPEPHTIFDAYALLNDWKRQRPALICQPGHWNAEGHITQLAHLPAPDGTDAHLALHIIPPPMPVYEG